MSNAKALDALNAYYAAFNAGDNDAMLACLADDVAHDINEGKRQSGKAAFASFLAHMNHCYRERLDDIVVMANAEGTHGAAEFIVDGEYLATDAGLPLATGQAYKLLAGAFFELADGKITRVTTYYNLTDWLRQIAG